MNINASSVANTNQFVYTRDVCQQERMLLTREVPIQGDAGNEAGNSQAAFPNDHISISPTAQALQEKAPEAAGVSPNEEPECCRLTLIRSVIERFVGRSLPVISSNDVAAAAQTPTTATDSVPETDTTDTNVPVQAGSLDLSLDYSRTDALMFSTTGTFQTKDNEEVSFSLELNFTRRILAEQTLTANFTDAIKDPFNIQYSGSAAEIKQTSFSFTFDCCQPGEEISLDAGAAPETAEAAPQANLAESAAHEPGVDGSEESSDVAAAQDGDSGTGEDNTESQTSPASDFLDRIRVWSQDVHGFHHPVLFGVKGAGAIFNEKQGAEFSLKKLSHFIHKMARMSDHLNQAQTQVTGKNETGTVSGSFFAESFTAGLLSACHS